MLISPSFNKKRDTFTMWLYFNPVQIMNTLKLISYYDSQETDKFILKIKTYFEV